LFQRYTIIARSSEPVDLNAEFRYFCGGNYQIFESKHGQTGRIMRLLAGTPFDREPHCERCDLPETECQCPPPAPVRAPPSKQTARLATEKRRHGRVMTLIRGLSPEDNDLPALLKQLKSTCGAGGTIADEVLEIQGSQIDRVRKQLKAMGYKVKG
jgi:translation initiation factor 1